jgi:DNA-binding MarR family transcriptional regulator
MQKTEAKALRNYRESKLYRPLARTFRLYNRMIVASLHARGFADFSPAFPQLLSNLDAAGTRINVLAARAGVTRQAAGQLLAEIERCGYIDRRPAPDDARATVVRFTARGRRLLTTIFSLVEEIESRFAEIAGADELKRMVAALSRLADALDPGGAFGHDDE